MKKKKRAAPGRAARRPSASKLYRLGYARALANLKTKRKQAARKGARTRAERPKKKAAPVAVGVVDEVRLYEAPEVEGAPAFPGTWKDFPVVATRWIVDVAIRREGRVIASETLEVDAGAWDDEPSPATVRRAVRAWYETWRAEHPDGDSPQAEIVLLALRRV